MDISSLALPYHSKFDNTLNIIGYTLSSEAALFENNPLLKLIKLENKKENIHEEQHARPGARSLTHSLNSTRFYIHSLRLYAAARQNTAHTNTLFLFSILQLLVFIRLNTFYLIPLSLSSLPSVYCVLRVYTVHYEMNVRKMTEIAV